MAGKRFEQLSALTAGVVPSKESGGEQAKPRSAPGQVMEFALQRDEAVRRAEEAEARTRELEEQLRGAKQSGGALALDLTQLHEVEGRRRTLTPEEYDDLKNNLAHNALASPITVRVRPEGGYEIVSGHNRVQIYRELGRTAIDAWLAEASDDEADDLAFFANAMAAKLPDYEKYRGYKRFMARHPALQQNELAQRVGISSSQLDRLLAFDTLPAQAHAILVRQPHLVGANAAEKLAALTKKERGAHVADALGKLAAGELKLEAEAIRYATTAGVEAKPAPAPATRTFKLGKANYATLRQVKNTVRIDCASEDEAKAINQAVHELIEQRLDRLKAK
jgi:ParB family chromosome partitioning protein